MANLKLATTNAAPRSAERQALADVIARRDAAKREIQSAQAAEEKAREHRYDAECKLERAKASNEVLCLDEYIQAVAADDTGAQVKSVAVSSADIRQLEQDYERWQLMEAATHERLRELESAALFIPVQSKVDAVVKAEADVSALLDGFETLRAELDRRLSILTWLQCGRLIKEDDLEAVKSAVASCYQLPRDEAAVRSWREAVRALETNGETKLPGAK